VLSHFNELEFYTFQDDAVEKELERHHHATGDDSKPVDNQLDDEQLYDLTIGDVIYDVLLTLREHPEVVRQLIESKLQCVQRKKNT